jgi:hypothetical protein
METMSEESDADAATSTPGGGHSTASIDGYYLDDASAPAADSDAPVASADTTTAAYALSAQQLPLLGRKSSSMDSWIPRIPADLASAAVREWLTQNADSSGIVRIQPTLSQRDTQKYIRIKAVKAPRIPGSRRRQISL